MAGCILDSTDWKPLIRRVNGVELGQAGEYREGYMGVSYALEFRSERLINVYSKPYRFLLRRLDELGYQCPELSYSKIKGGGLSIYIPPKDPRLKRWRMEILSVVTWAYSKFPEQGVDLRDLTNEGTLRES